jgi:large subunit ribosomal protein L1
MYVEALGSVEKNKEYDTTEAIKVLKSLKTRKFDETVDLALKLNIDAKKTDMNVRGSFVLPNGTGKSKRVLVITKTKADEASAAEYCGAEETKEEE